MDAVSAAADAIEGIRERRVEGRTGGKLGEGARDKSPSPSPKPSPPTPYRGLGGVFEGRAGAVVLPRPSSQIPILISRS